MPIAVAEVLIATFSIGLLIASVWMLVYPEAAARYVCEQEEVTPSKARTTVRITAIVLLFFAFAGFHLVFVHGVRPFPPGENGVGI